MLYAHLSSPMRTTCPAHLIFLALIILITLIILGENVDNTRDKIDEVGFRI
jgi:hypothetical protein